MKTCALAVFGLVLTGCPAVVLRQRDNYVAELAFTNRLVREGSVLVRASLQDHCVCEANVWRPTDATTTAVQCQDRAGWWQVYATRWNWHHSMMLYNARVRDTRPPAAPALPGTCDLPATPVEPPSQ